MLQQSVWISPWYTVVDYDMSTIVRTSNNDMLSIYITHLRLVNDNYRIRCSEKRTRIDAFPRPCPIRSTFPIYFRILRLLKRYHITFFSISRYQRKSCVSIAMLPFPIVVMPLEIVNSIERRFVENYRRYVRTVDAIANFFLCIRLHDKIF